MSSQTQDRLYPHEDPEDLTNEQLLREVLAIDQDLPIDDRVERALDQLEESSS